MFAVKDAYLTAGLTPPRYNWPPVQGIHTEEGSWPSWVLGMDVASQSPRGTVLGTVYLHDQHQAPAARPRAEAGPALAELPEAKQEKHTVLILSKPHHLHFIC